ncbi:MAG: toll/interleukin-1 receptor domain-containing protein [Pirellulaceae bacterium]|nr:toll/interleukin-1 receptor domain-containing protein [Pirellulaceae bacterium]
MAADPLLYCLDQISDYRQFERLGHDLMAVEGYAGIEPLGVTGDLGRDAIHVCRAKGTTIFAYSTEEKWRPKLLSDAKKVQEHGHTCDRFVFVTSRDVSVASRDALIKDFQTTFAWHFDLYSRERLRVLLLSNPAILRAHPALFPPNFVREILAGSDAPRETVVVLGSKIDLAFIRWMVARLTAIGYRVWTPMLDRTAGRSGANELDTLVREGAHRVLVVVSRGSAVDKELIADRSCALTHGRDDRRSGLVIPIDLDGVDRGSLEPGLAGLTFVDFHGNWSRGFGHLVKNLESAETPKAKEGHSQAAIAWYCSDERRVVGAGIETIVSNLFEIETIPKIVRRFVSPKPLNEEQQRALALEWGYRALDARTFLSFTLPPPSHAASLNLTARGGSIWAAVHEIDGIRPVNLVKELLRKSMTVRSVELGMRFCQNLKLCYFPLGLLDGDWLTFVGVDGDATRVLATGTRRNETARYHLAPSFGIEHDGYVEWAVLLRLRFRWSDVNGDLLPKRTAKALRKKLGNGWWNKDWGNRDMAVMQFLAHGADRIRIGKGDEELVVNPRPLDFESPLQIDEAALESLGLPPACPDLRQEESNADDEDSEGLANAQVSDDSGASA